MSNYVKPKMKFVDIVNPENVANVCWGGATESLATPAEKNKGQDLVWRYYGGVFENDNVDDEDISDGKKTYIDFRVGTTNCSQATSSMIKIQDTSVGSAERQKQLFDHLVAIYDGNSNRGSNWNGETSITPIISSK